MEGYKCDMCAMTFTGLACFQQHEAGKNHKKKLRLYQMEGPGSSTDQAYRTLNQESNQAGIYCMICSLNFTSLNSFQAHANSLEHADMIRKKSMSESIVSLDEPDASINHLQKELESSMAFPNSACLISYGECKICKKNFTGLEPYQQHLASAAHKKKAALSQCSSGENDLGPEGFKPFTTGNSILSYAECVACQKLFSGPEPYQQHIVSAAHKKKIAISQYFSERNEDQNDLIQLPEGLKPFQSTSSFPSCHAECVACQKQFSGPEPYQLHLDSVTHLKKSAMHAALNTDRQNKLEEKVDLQLSNVLGSFAECKLCLKQFSGPENYEQHLVSAGHRKKVNMQPLVNVTTDGNNQKVQLFRCDICESTFTDHTQYDFHLNSSLICKMQLLKIMRSDADPFVQLDKVSQNYYCEVCRIQCSGPIPYKQHVSGQDHCKNLRVAAIEARLKNASENMPKSPLLTLSVSPNSPVMDDQLNNEVITKKVQLNDLNFLVCNNDKSNEFSKTLPFNQDLIFGDALKHLNVILPENMNVTIFEPDDIIVFGDSLKENNMEKILNIDDF